MKKESPIRKELPEDARVIRHILSCAFPTAEEANLVEKLRQNRKIRLSLVTTDGGKVVGHILFTDAKIQGSTCRARIAALAPVTVLPEYQNQGIGTRLIKKGIRDLKKSGYAAVIVLGDPVYYRRFGFEKASQYGFGNEYGVDEEFRILILNRNQMTDGGGLITYQPEFKDL